MYIFEQLNISRGKSDYPRNLDTNFRMTQKTYMLIYANINSETAYAYFCLLTTI